jgi:hypothetical protein
MKRLNSLSMDRGIFPRYARVLADAFYARFVERVMGSGQTSVEASPLAIAVGLAAHGIHRIVRILDDLQLQWCRPLDDLFASMPEPGIMPRALV